MDNYEYVCNNIVVFEKIFSCHISAMTYQGKKLQSSKNIDVTPDMAFETKDGKYGALNEIKAWLPREKSYWNDAVTQIQSYDNNLSGWKFLGKKDHDIMITLPPQFTTDFFDFVKDLEKKGIKINRNFAVIQSSRQERTNKTIFIKKDHGDIAHDKLGKELRKGISYNMHNILRDLNQLKFYDAKPPKVYTMIQLWDIFPDFIVSREKQIQLERGTVEIRLSADKIRKKLSKLTPSSNPHCIKAGWIKEALEEFKMLGMVKQSDTYGKEFIIKYRKPEETREFILGLMDKKKKP